MPEPMPTVVTLQAITDAFNRHDLDAIMALDRGAVEGVTWRPVIRIGCRSVAP